MPESARRAVGRLLVAAILALPAAATARADLVLERTVRDRRTSPLGLVSLAERREQVFVGARRVLIVDLVFGEDTLVQLDRGLLIRIHRLSRTARTVRLADRAAARQQFVAELRAVAERVQGTEAAGELAALIAALEFADGRDAATEVKAGADTAQLCARDVQPVTLDQSGRKVAALWLAAAPESAAALLEVYEDLGYLPAGARARLDAVGRLPLRFEGRLIDGLDRVERTETVTRVSEETVPAARYEVPEGFAVDEEPTAGPPLLPEDPPGGREDADAKPDKPDEGKETKKKEDKPARPDRDRR